LPIGECFGAVPFEGAHLDKPPTEAAAVIHAKQNGRNSFRPLNI
jgi:hypothetical protein